MSLGAYIPSDANATLTARATAAATDIVEGLRGATLEEVIAEIRTSTVTPAKLVDHFVALLKQHAAGALVNAANGTATEAIALGRQHEAEVYRDDVALVEYSALLDNATCAECRRQDGKTYKMGSAEYAKHQPPLRTCRGRGRCRCVYIYILRDEPGAGAPPPKGPKLVPPPTQPPLIPPPAHVPMLPAPKLVPISASPIPLAPKLPPKVKTAPLVVVPLAPPKPVVVAQPAPPAPAKPRRSTAGDVLPHARPDALQKATDHIARGLRDEDLSDDKIRADLKQRVVTDVTARVMASPELLARARAALIEKGTPNVTAPGGNAVVQTIVEARIDSLNRVWASTSSDAHPKAIAVQIAAAEEFGLNIASVKRLAKVVTSRGTAGQRAWKDAVKQLDEPGEREITKTALRAMYENTQADFKARGMTHVALERGFYTDVKALPKAAREKLGTLEPIDPNVPSLGGRYVPKANGKAIVKSDLAPLSSFSPDAETARNFSYGGDVLNGQVALVLKGTVPVERIFATTRTGIGCLNEYEYVMLETPGKLEMRVTLTNQTTMMPSTWKPK